MIGAAISPWIEELPICAHRDTVLFRLFVFDLRHFLLFSAKFVQRCLRLEGFIKPAIHTALQVEGAHHGYVTGLGSVGVVAPLPGDLCNGALPHELETCVFI